MIEKGATPVSGDLFSLLNGRSILVTGGTGSFGRMFVRRVVEKCQPSRLVIFSRDELKQFEMQHIYPVSKYPFLRYFIGDVRDLNRLVMAFRGIDFVIHAAAIKQVPTAEYNPYECINTNVIGAENVSQAAIQNHVSRVIALSTDKAANPINLYGASKLASDKIFIAANNLVGAEKPRFSVVRYGNVIGSRGSVVPFFRRLIAESATSLPITDPRMTRFWLTVQQGVDFVISCLGMMRGGEIFIPKIPSMRIVDVAQVIGPGLKQHVVGIRPGEKLHEVMITADEARYTLELQDRYVIEPAFPMTVRAPLDEPHCAVPENFSYDSASNPDFLTPDKFRALLEALDRESLA